MDVKTGDKKEWLKPVAVCDRCGREFLTLPQRRPYVDGYGYQRTGEVCGGSLTLTEKGKAVKDGAKPLARPRPADRTVQAGGL